MAENHQEVTKTEREIPVFTVLKNNCILKNIYLLDNPPSISSLTEEILDQESEMVVGRHPDCNIKLEHPSISRYHLRIHSKPYSRSLYVTDLSSVHGTWISGKKVDPGVKIKLNEGDILQLGGSSRLYRLHWVPLSRAYDMDNPFCPQLDPADDIEEETEGTIDQEADSLIRNDHNQTLGGHLVEGLELLFSDENQCFSGHRMNPSTPLKVEEFHHSSYNEKELENENSPDKENGDSNVIQSCLSDKENSTPETPSPSSPVPNTGSQIESIEISGMNSNKRSNLMNIWSRRGKARSVQIDTGLSREKNAIISSQTCSPCENHEIESVLNNHFASPGQEELFTPDKENCSPNSILVRSLKNVSMVSTPISSLNLEEEVFTPDKENMTPNISMIWSMKKNMGKLDEIQHPKSYRSSPLEATRCNTYEEKDMPLPRRGSESRHKRVLQEKISKASESKSCASLKKELNVSKGRPDRDPFRSQLVNSTSGEKVNPRPPLGEVSGRGGRFVSYAEFEEVVHLHNKNGEQNKRWTIIVDTSCVLNQKSRSELQLLRGLKGTSLIVPRIVVRELDCMLRRGSFFRSTAQVSAALEWIDDCMANSKEWIHVQSSAEESRLIPPTPSASPSLHWFSEDKGGAFSLSKVVPFSPYSLQEIVTPTAEDHILECALLFKRLRNEGQFVLLSDDVALKIKAMAEGVICETAEEFRRSLGNPFSERFLYSDSSPRGLTWSCTDDAVLKEKYYPSPLKKLSKSGEGGGAAAKGLKLVLLHNSSFRQAPTSCRLNKDTAKIDS